MIIAAGISVPGEGNADAAGRTYSAPAGVGASGSLTGHRAEIGLGHNPLTARPLDDQYF
jgi:hypothetical protein